MTTMNLTTDPWVPVIASSGAQQLLSLQELFAAAHEVRDVCAKPHEKIALLRLLICITQAALNGPENYDDWQTCQERIQLSAKAYLQKWAGSFELYGEGDRFLQVPGLRPAKEEGEGTPATKLDLMLATGNTAFFFDNAGGESRIISDARVALTLLTFQCFSPGGRIGVALWNGTDTPGKGSSNHAPCTPAGMLHTFLRGDSLLATIHLNLMNREQIADLPGEGWGCPIWEKPVRAASEKGTIANAAKTYLGRLVPISRAIQLRPGGNSLILANGLEYPLFPAVRDPFTTIIQRDEEPGVLSASLGRSVWRQLAAIAVKRRSAQDTLGGPVALGNLEEGRGATVWVGALVTDKAKIEDTMEAAYDLPAGLFMDEGRKLYEEGVALAETWQSVLHRCIRTYAEKLKLEPAPTDRGKHHFWTQVEQHVPILLRLADSPSSAGDLANSEWGRAVKSAAYAAYEFACACQSPRQIEAFALGRQWLRLPDPKKTSSSPKKSRKSKVSA